MANHVSHGSLPYPIKNARYSIIVPYLDADGDPTDPTTPDTEFSVDNGAFADCAEEVTTTTGSNGIGYITLTGAETNGSLLALAFKVASGPKNTLATLYPRSLAIVGSGTLSAGSAGGGTLGTILAYDVTGCFIRTTGGTGGGGTGGANNQARKIVTYTPSTGAFAVEPNWETTPDNTTTYDVLLPEGVTLGMLRTLNPATPGRAAVVDASGLIDANTVKIGPSGSGTAQTARDLGAITANTITHLNQIYDTDYATVYDTTNKAFLSKLGNFAMGGSSLALTTGAISCTTLTASGAVAFQSTFAITGATTFTGAVIGTNASNDLRINGAVPGAAGGVFIAGSNAATTFASLTVTGATVHTGNVSMVAGLSITQSSSNASALVITGNGTGHGAAITGGSGTSADAVHLVSAASVEGHGLYVLGTGQGEGIHAQGGDTLGNGINAIGGAGGEGLVCQGGTGNVAGLACYGSGTKAGLFAFGGGSTGSPGAWFAGQGGGPGLRSDGDGNGAGILATGGATGVPTGADGLTLVAAGTGKNLDSTTMGQIASTTLTTQMTESYAADGVAPTLAQAMFLTMQSVAEFSINSTTVTVKKLDGATTAATYTLDDATTPTSRTRAT